MKNFEMSIN